MVPTEKDAYKFFEDGGHLPAGYESFYPVIYSLENCFPLVKLGQAERWRPDPTPPASPCAASGWVYQLLCLVVSPAFLRVFRWAQICLGWILATLFVAGLTGIVRKD
jgi:hypothetical protein